MHRTAYTCDSQNPHPSACLTSSEAHVQSTQFCSLPRDPNAFHLFSTGKSSRSASCLFRWSRLSSTSFTRHACRSCNPRQQICFSVGPNSLPCILTPTPKESMDFVYACISPVGECGVNPEIFVPCPGIFPTSFTPEGMEHVCPTASNPSRQPVLPPVQIPRA